MGKNKAEEFSVRDNRVARVAKALAHPARVAIIRLLRQKNTCQCSHIVDELPLAQSTVSQHLKELKAAGLIKGTVSGTGICYCLDAQALEEARLHMADFMNEPTISPSKCC